MRKLRVALVVKQSTSTRQRSLRNMGYWSYPVEEFEWDHFDLFQALGNTLSAYDFIFIEDASKGIDLRFKGLPIVYLSIDETLDEAHFHVRHSQAKLADLVLVDHGALELFADACSRVRRFNYCVNDEIFKPLDKSVDIAYHCNSGESRGFPGGKERNLLRLELDRIRRDRGYSFQSGSIGILEYASSFGKAKVVVNLPRTMQNRPHRIFDAMACKAAVLTGQIPMVSYDRLEQGTHYTQFANDAELERELRHLITQDNWQQTAQAGYNLVMQYHTWKTRAKELRLILQDEFGIGG